VACDARRLGGLAHELTLPAGRFRRLAALIAVFPRFFGNPPQLLRLAAGSLRGGDLRSNIFVWHFVDPD
jgi:hypothetical protein